MREPLVEVATHPVDLAGLVGQRLVAPAVGHRAEQRDQGGRAGQHDPALGGVLDEGARRRRARPPGTTRRGGRAPRTPGSRAGSASSAWSPAARCGRAAAARGGPGGPSRSVGLVGRGGVEEGVERDLGVDHDAAAAGQPHHQVGTLGAVGELDLLVEVAAVDQPGQLDRPAQVELAPAAADLGPAERGGEGLRLAPQAVGGVAHVEHLLVELALPGRPRVLEALQLVTEPVEALHDLGLVDHALPQPLDVRRSGARPEHADDRAQREPHEKHHQLRHHVHTATVPGTTDNTG